MYDVFEEIDKTPTEELTWDTHIYPFLKELIGWYPTSSQFIPLIRSNDKFYYIYSKRNNISELEHMPHSTFVCEYNYSQYMLENLVNNRCYSDDLEYPLSKLLWKYRCDKELCTLIWAHGIVYEFKMKNQTIGPLDYSHTKWIFKLFMRLSEEISNKEIKIYSRTDKRFLPPIDNWFIYSQEHLDNLKSPSEILRFIADIRRTFLSEYRFFCYF